MREIKKINKIIESLSGDNRTKNIFLNVIQNEFITFHSRIIIPHIPAKELDYKLAKDIIPAIAENIPEFLYKHKILHEKKPASDQHCLHFMQRFEGKLLNFVHLFKFDLKFGGDSTNIIEKGTTQLYPSYYTDRIYYKSRLIPELKNTKKPDDDFQPIRLKEIISDESDDSIFVSAVFDEIDTRKISVNICSNLPQEIFTIPPKIYPFISYDYLTACFNVLYPTVDEIEKALEIFEPLFISIYSTYHKIENLVSIDKITDTFAKELSMEAEKVVLRNEFIEILKSYFQRFKLYSDEQLALLGRRRVDIDFSN